MIVTCWSVKGGSGTTVVAACLALVASRLRQCETLLVDLAGDAPAVLGIDEPTPAGVLDWIRATAVGAGGARGDAGAPGAIAAMEITVDERLSVLPWGSTRAGGLPLSTVEVLMTRLAGDGRLVVVDAGTVSPDGTDGIRHRFIRGADRSLLVTRACYLAMRHATRTSLEPDGTVLVAEPGRSLGAADVASVTGAPVVAEISCEPQLARVVDAGLLCSRIPRGVERSLLDVLGG